LFHTHTHYQLVLRKLSHNTRHTHARQGVKKKEILEKNNAVVLHTFPTHTHTSKLFFFSTEHITKTGPQKQQKLTKNFREIKQKSLFPLHQTYTTHTLSLFALDNSQCYLFLLISFVFLWFFSSSFRPLPRGCCKTDRLFLTRALNCIITEKKKQRFVVAKKKYKIRRLVGNSLTTHEGKKRQEITLETAKMYLTPGYYTHNQGGSSISKKFNQSSSSLSMD